MNKKIHYKLELIYIKYSPIIMSLCLLSNNILAYFDIYTEEIGGYIYSFSLLTIGHMYNSSYTYKFCKYHRMFIHYIVVNNLTNAYDYYIGIPINDRNLLIMNLIIAGIFLFLILYYHQKYDGRNNNESIK